jgi:FtsP/CotA-like multicopper oxidase with cupredoxin domain
MIKYKCNTTGRVNIEILSEENETITQTVSASSSSTGNDAFYTSTLAENLATELLNEYLENLTNETINKFNTKIRLNSELTSYIDDGYNVMLPIQTLQNLIGIRLWTSNNSQSTTHEFYPNYPYDLAKYPTFIVENANMTFGLPTLQLKRDEKLQFRTSNTSSYTFNIHWHGVNFSPFNDGATTPTLFGEGTKIGITNIFDTYFYNNSCVAWNHAHPMFYSSPLTYLGFFAFVPIFDSITSDIDEIFVYGNNWIPLGVHDITFDKQGVIDLTPIYTQNWRGDYTCINGTVAVGWIKESNSDYISKFYQVSSNNLIKISILNATASFRCFYIGVCDKFNKIHKFYYIQNDQGYRNPYLADILYISVGARITILFDIKDFPDEEAYIFFYDFDLTNNTGFIYDTSISDDLLTLQDGKLVSSPYGILPVPENYSLKKYLKITYDGTYQNNLKEVLTLIKKKVFGKNYDFVESLPYPVEIIDYEKYLNKDYFYNLPDFENDIPKRNLLFFFDNITSKSNGATDFISSGTDRYMADMWNSYEYEMYIETKDDLYLPTCLFSISKYKGDYLKYSNYRMQDNHELFINIYFNDECNNGCNCGSICENKVSVKIEFPESERPLNIKEWSQMVNEMYSKTFFTNKNGEIMKVSDILEYTWEPYLYRFDYLENLDKISEKEFYNPPLFLKTVRILNINKSDYIIELNAPFTLLTFFGKPFTAMEITSMSMDTSMNTTHMKHMSHTTDISMNTTDMSMDMMNMSNNLQVIFPFAGSRSGDIEYPTNMQFFNLKINKKETYYGFCDGFLNDNFYNFSVKKNDSEKWCYNNGDTESSHPFHFHMTSGFITLKDNLNNKLFYKKKGEEIFNFLSYSKDTYDLPPQHYITMRVKFPNHSSEEGQIPYLGYMVHCHFMAHHDMNMMNQFFVYKEKSVYFK